MPNHIKRHHHNLRSPCSVNRDSLRDLTVYINTRLGQPIYMYLFIEANQFANLTQTPRRDRRNIYDIRSTINNVTSAHHPKRREEKKGYWRKRIIHRRFIPFMYEIRLAKYFGLYIESWQRTRKMAGREQRLPAEWPTKRMTSSSCQRSYIYIFPFQKYGSDRHQMDRRKIHLIITDSTCPAVGREPYSAVKQKNGAVYLP